MGKPRAMVARQGGSGVKVEYVRSRQALRVTGWNEHGASSPVEIGLPGLLEGLDIAPEELGAPVRYLIFAGFHGRPRGGTDDLAGVFLSESDARLAFRRLRVERSDKEGWAELTAVGGRSRVIRLAWFGRDPRTDGAGHPRTSPARRFRWRGAA